MRFLLVTFLFSMAGCAGVEHEVIPAEAYSNEVSLATDTHSAQMLRALPAAASALPVSVYEFGDFTGQAKPGENSQTSRAVTQGGLAILKKALLDAGNHSWFRVLERGGLNDLLQERKIIRAMRDEYAGPDGKPLPAIGPLLYSGLLLEGGIVSYESNVLNGGLGARYLGIGADTKYSRDMVTVYLRAVNVNSGEVVLSVNTSKTIYSKSIQGGIFKFVSYDKIAEGETGFSYNEPPQLAVRQAIELAVYSLIIEGSDQGLWSFKDAISGRTTIDAYNQKYRPERVANTATVENAGAKQVGAMERAPSIIHEESIPVVREASYGLSPRSSETESRRQPASPRPAEPVIRPEAHKVVPAVSTPPPPVGHLRPGWYVKLFAMSDSGALPQKAVDLLQSNGFPLTIDGGQALVGPLVSPDIASNIRALVSATLRPLGSNCPRLNLELWHL